MILEVSGLKKVFCTREGFFGGKAKRIAAVDNVTFAVEKDESLGIIGESGCGKTTLARLILGLIIPDEGYARFNPDIIHDVRKDVQMVFQNPLSSLNPLMRVKDALAEPLLIHRLVPRERVDEDVGRLLNAVRLPQEVIRRYPRELSQGQRQRVCLARAIAPSPKLLILDEPLSALDLSVQGQILTLLRELRDERGMAYFLISHNIAHVRTLCRRALVMHKGMVLETGSTEKLINSPENDYTRRLVKAAALK